MPKNDFLARIQRQKAQEINVRTLFTMQWCADAAAIAANEVFNRKGDKIAEFLKKMSEYSREIAEMTDSDARGDKTIEYTKTKIDEKLKEILGEHFEPWDERYIV